MDDHVRIPEDSQSEWIAQLAPHAFWFSSGPRALHVSPCPKVLGLPVVGVSGTVEFTTWLKKTNVCSIMNRRVFDNDFVVTLA